MFFCFFPAHYSHFSFFIIVFFGLSCFSAGSIVFSALLQLFYDFLKSIISCFPLLTRSWFSATTGSIPYTFLFFSGFFIFFCWFSCLDIFCFVCLLSSFRLPSLRFSSFHFARCLISQLILLLILLLPCFRYFYLYDLFDSSISSAFTLFLFL